MKLISCFLQDSDQYQVTRALLAAGSSATILSSTGAYFRRGNTTLMIGAPDDQVPAVMDTLRANTAEPSDPGLKRATVFVLSVDRFEQVQ